MLEEGDEIVAADVDVDGEDEDEEDGGGIFLGV